MKSRSTAMGLRLSRNLGFQNLIGKSGGRAVFLLLQVLLAYKMPIEDFADYAIFWSSMRLFTFFGANNYYILYFNQERENILKNHKISGGLIKSVLCSYALFSLVLIPASLFLFGSVYITFLLCLASLAFVVIRTFSEISKVDDNIKLSIFIEDIFLYFVLFMLILSAVFFIGTEFIVIATSITLSIVLTAVLGVFMFYKKFNMPFKISIDGAVFIWPDFLRGVNYSLLRGNDVVVNFLIRYLGKVFFGGIFVAYAHVMIQFFNIFTILTVAVVSGFQSKITVRDPIDFNIGFIKDNYRKIAKTLWPFIAVLFLILVIFNKNVISLAFPKFVGQSYLLIFISVIGLIYALLQPLVFIFIYNNRFPNLLSTNRFQYAVLCLFLLFPLIGVDNDFWFMSLIIICTLIQGFMCGLKTKKLAGH